MIILAIAIAMLFLGSVSAADDDIDANLTAIDNSQELGELNGGSDIDGVDTDDTVSAVNENDEEILTADTPGYAYIWNHDSDGRPSAASYNTPTTSDQTYSNYVTGQKVSIDMWMRSLSGTWYLNVNNKDEGSYYNGNSYEWSDGVFEFEFSNAGQYTMYVYYKGSSSNYVSNKLIYDVKEATKETEVNIVLDKTTIAPGDNVKITPSAVVKGTTTEVTSGQFEIYVNGQKQKTINVGESYEYSNSVENIYYVYAKYIAATGYENSTSQTIAFVVNTDTTIIATNTKIEFDKSVVGPSGKIIITPIVETPNGVVSGTVDLYDGEDNLIEANVVIGDPYTYTVSDVSGYYQIYARYSGNTELNYAPSNSTKSTYKIKGQLDIKLTVDGETEFNAIGAYSSYSSNIINYIFYADCNGYSPLLKVYDVYDGETNIVYDGNVHGDSQQISMWFSYNSERGPHIVYVEFEGDDEYLPSRSNNVTFNVYEKISYSNSITSKLNFNPSSVMEGDYIEITPSVQYYSSGYKNAPGTVTIFDDSDRTIELGTVNANEAFSYRIPFSDSESSYTYYVYATYNGGVDDDNYNLFESGNLQGYFTVTIPKKTTLTLENTTDLNINEGERVTIKPTIVDSDGKTVTSGIISWFVDGQWVANLTTTDSYTTDSNLNAYNHIISAKFVGGNGYKESSSENNIEVIINQIPSEIKISIGLDKTSVSKDGTITVTPTVTLNGETVSEGIVVFYNESDEKIGQINLTEESTFTYTVIGEAGGSHQIWAKYGETNSARKDYKIKGILTITLTRNGEGLVKVGDTVYFTITYSDSISEGLELWVNDTRIDGEDGTESTSVTVSAAGLNNVFIKFLGNDDFEPTESNNVSIDVVKPLDTNTTLVLNPGDVLSGKNITIFPSVVDENGNPVTVGVVKIYKTQDYYYADPVATINLADISGNYIDTTLLAGQSDWLYGVYTGYTTETTVYNKSPVSVGVKYTILNSNTVSLTVNDKTEITIEEGTSFDVKATLTGGDGTITLYIDGVANTTLTKGESKSLTLPVKTYKLYANYTRGSDTYASAVSNEVTVNVIEKSVTKEITVSVESVTLSAQAVIKVTANVDGKYTIDVNGTEVNVTVSGGSGSELISLPAGDYYANVTGQDGATITNAVFTVYPEPKNGDLKIRDNSYPENATIAIVSGGDITISIEYYAEKINFADILTEEIMFYVGGNPKSIENIVYDEFTGAFRFTINQTSDFTVKATYKVLAYGNEKTIESNILTYHVEINKKEVVLNDTVLSVNDGTTPVFSIDLDETATGNLTVIVNGKPYTKQLENGKATVDITDLPAGNYTATVIYTGDETHNRSETTAKFTVKEQDDNTADKALEVNVPEASTNPTFSINLPSDAKGNLTVVVDGKTYTKPLVNGSASLTIEDLAPGEHNVTVSYSGDGKYSPMSKNTTISIPKPVLSNNKDVTMLYSSGASYKVRVTIDGKVVVGEKVTIKFNGKTYIRSTDKNGYATLKLPDTKPKAGKYTIQVLFKGVKTSNKVKINSIIKAKNLKAKKSKKVTKIQVTLKKVNNKFLKGKTVKIKFRGKTYKAKTNKKGVATFKIKKNVFKKLKVGKKYTYKVTYGKDTASKKITIRR